MRAILKLEDQLLMKGFEIDDIISYFLDLENTEDNVCNFFCSNQHAPLHTPLTTPIMQAEQYLTLLQHLRDCGFQDENIVKAIKKSQSLDASMVIDNIYKPWSRMASTDDLKGSPSQEVLN